MGLEGLFAVTGGGSGIGAGVARALRAAGADVAVLDRHARRATEVAAEIGGTAHVLDVADPEAVREVFATFGPLRGLVSCAGVAYSAPLVAHTFEDWRRVVSIHLDGTFLCLQAAARNMLRHGVEGTIVNVSSVNATFVHRGLGAYAAAKAGITMLTKVAAAELAASGIRVNAVAPGIVATNMSRGLVEDPAAVRVWTDPIAMGRVGQPDDIAAVVVFLSGDESRWLVGQTLATDGGGSLRVEPKMQPDELYTRAGLLALLDEADH